MIAKAVQLCFWLASASLFGGFLVGCYSTADPFLVDEDTLGDDGSGEQISSSVTNIPERTLTSTPEPISTDKWEPFEIRAEVRQISVGDPNEIRLQAYQIGDESLRVSAIFALASDIDGRILGFPEPNLTAIRDYKEVSMYALSDAPESAGSRSGSNVQDGNRIQMLYFLLNSLRSGEIDYIVMPEWSHNDLPNRAHPSLVGRVGESLEEVMNLNLSAVIHITDHRTGDVYVFTGNSDIPEGFVEANETSYFLVFPFTDKFEEAFALYNTFSRFYNEGPEIALIGGMWVVTNDELDLGYDLKGSFLPNSDIGHSSQQN